MSSQAKSCTFFTENLISGKMIVPEKRNSPLQTQNDAWIPKIRVFLVPYYPKTPEKVQDFALKTILAGYGTIRRFLLQWPAQNAIRARPDIVCLSLPLLQVSGFDRFRQKHLFLLLWRNFSPDLFI